MSSTAAKRDRSCTSSCTRLPDSSITFAVGQDVPLATGGLTSSMLGGCHDLTERLGAATAASGSTPAMCDSEIAVFSAVAGRELLRLASSISVRTWLARESFGDSARKVLRA